MKQNEEMLTKILTPEEFIALQEAIQSQSPFWATGKRNRFSNFFSMKNFEDLVNQSGIWTPDRFEIYLDAKKMPPHNYFSQMSTQGPPKNKLFEMGLQQFLDRGASIVLNDIDTLTPGLKTLRKMLTDFTGGKVECNLYYSQTNHQAFPLHFDVHDVYAFQVSGEKRWHVYEQISPYPINHINFRGLGKETHEKNKGKITQDIVMQRGDFFYLPAGFYHQAICTGNASLHLSFSSVEMIGLEVISQLYEAAVKEAAFRAPINRSLLNKDLGLEDYLEQLAIKFTKLLGEETFVENIKNQLKQYPYPHHKIKLPRK